MSQHPPDESSTDDHQHERWGDFEVWDEYQQGDPRYSVSELAWGTSEPEDVDWDFASLQTEGADQQAIRDARSDHYHKHLTPVQRRFRSLCSTYRVEPSWLIQQLRDQGNKCTLCHGRIWWVAELDAVNVRRKLQIDHVWPRSKGGVSCICSYQLLCEPCNLAKGATIPRGRTDGVCACPREIREERERLGR